MHRRLLLMATLLATAGPATPKPDGRPTASDPVRLILNNPAGREAPSHTCDVELCTSLLELIERSEKSIDFAIYGMRGQPQIFDALIAAKERGVVVRGVIDRTVDGANYYKDTEALVEKIGTVHDDLQTDKHTAARQQSYDDSTATCWMTPPEGFLGPRQCVGYDIGDRCIVAVHASREALTFQGDIMHNKYFVVDGKYLWMGSTNVSDSGTGGYNANLAAVVNSPTVADWYAKEFTQMWEGRYHDDKRSHRPMYTKLADGVSVEGWFSPQDRPMTRGVRPLLQRARERIDIGIFFLTHKGIAKDLIEAHRRGVKIRIMIDATAAKNGYTKHELIRATGIPVKVENWGGKMHMKAAAIDGRIVVMGSMNWTSAGENGNDENTIILRSSKHAEQFHKFYDKLWKTVPDRWLEGRPDPESPDSTTACTDGSDNDFDHLRDAEDPGCSGDGPPLPELPPYRIVPKADGHGLIKGNVSSEGKRIYHVPNGSYYDKVDVSLGSGEQYFCSEEDAKAAGFYRSSN